MAEQELDEVRTQRTALAIEARERAALEAKGGDPVPLVERLGIPTALFERANVSANTSEIEAAFVIFEQLRAAAVADADQGARPTRRRPLTSGDNRCNGHHGVDNADRSWSRYKRRRVLPGLRGAGRGESGGPRDK